MSKKVDPIEQFLKIRGQIEALHREISALSSKKPDDDADPFL